MVMEGRKEGEGEERCVEGRREKERETEVEGRKLCRIHINIYSYS